MGDKSPKSKEKAKKQKQDNKHRSQPEPVQPTSGTQKTPQQK